MATRSIVSFIARAFIFIQRLESHMGVVRCAGGLRAQPGSAIAVSDDKLTDKDVITLPWDLVRA
jgi:hypothetical protein